MTAMLTVTLLIAFAALVYAVCKGGQCEVLAMENARLLASAQGWRTAYENVRDENRAVTHLGGIRGEDS